MSFSSLQLDPIVISSTDLLTLHNERPVGSGQTMPGVTPDLYSTYTIPVSGQVLLRELPQQNSLSVPTGTTVIQVPGGPLTEVLGLPRVSQFQVNYNDGTVTFNTADAGKTVLIAYTGLGSVVKAEHINNIAVPFFNLYNSLKDLEISGTSYTFPGDVTINGDFNVVGVINREASEVINIKDQIIFLNQNVTTHAGFVGLEISIGNASQGSASNPQFVWSEADSTWNFTSTASGPGSTFKVYDKGGVQVTRLSAIQESALVATLGANDGGLQWFNTATNQFVGWNGTAVVILG